MGTSDSSIPVIGVVGGIGSGKSTAASQFAALGCAVIDGDAIGHELLRREDVRQEVHRRWGDAVFTDAGEVDRRALAKIVFADETQLSALNRILHPRIRRRMVEQIKSFQGEDIPAIVLARRLAELTSMKLPRVFYSDSGATALISAPSS